jgi:hypothetical protein
MNVRKRILVSMALAVTALPLAAQTGSAPDEREDNRRQLERWKDQPEEMARLRRLAVYFLALPEDRKSRLVDLDQILHQEPPKSRKRLEKVLKRYGAWLESLDPVQQKKIKDAPDSKTRLQIVKKIRADDWLKKQPRALQEEMAKLEGAQWNERIHALRDKERKQKILWLISSRFLGELEAKQPMPARLSDFGEKTATFFNEYLLPRLDAKERDRLKKAEGKWPLFPMTLVALADRHPPALPDKVWPRNFKELPKDVQKRIVKIKDGKPKVSGKFSQLAKKEGLARAATLLKGPPFPNELWPKSKAALSDQVKKFISTKLDHVLSKEEFHKLNQAEDRGWPSYPLMLQKLAEDHDLQVPWHSLPGNPETWDRYRLKRRLEKQ